MSKRIHVIINPAAGRPEPILNTLNAVFHPLGVVWDVSLTHASGDAFRMAQKAAAEGVDVVAAYGGDGTVMEVARALQGDRIPMAILPGGTANLMSVELGIPRKLELAARIAASEDSKVCPVDMGRLGEEHFLLRVGMGFAARKVQLADRELKDRFGVLAYSIAGLKALQDNQKAHYRFTLDGEVIESEGVTCLVDNAGNIGISGISPRDVSVSDGLLDVILVRDARVRSWVAVGAGIAGGQPDPDYVQHWQARDIRIEVDPPQPVQVDGEIWGDTPVSIQAVPGAVGILVPSSGN